MKDVQSTGHEPILIQEIREPAYPKSRFFLMREDLLPEAFGGNKVRIGKEYIRDLKEQGCDAMLAYGDRRSNLCRVLAVLCYQEGIPLRVLTAPEDTPQRNLRKSSSNEHIISLLGAEFCRTEGNVSESVIREMNRFRAEGRKPYYIFGDAYGRGNEGTAARAYAGVWRRIAEWEKEHDTYFDLIAVPYGNGCTYGGILAGILQDYMSDRSLRDHCCDGGTDRSGSQDGSSGCDVSGSDIFRNRKNRRTVGISISSRTPERAERVLYETVQGYFQKEKLPLPSLETVAELSNLHTEYNCGGYGIVTDEVRETARRMLQTNGIGLPAIYGAKAYSGLLRYLKETDADGMNILFIHTGGTPLFYDDLREEY